MEFSRREDADEAGAGSPHTPLHRSIPANGLTGTPVAAASAAAGARRQYHECLRNHAAAAGGHVVDGCCEFMPSSPEDPLTCAACECHRSFHRRDPSPGRASAGPQPPLLAAGRPAAPVLLPPAATKHPPSHRLPFPYRTPSVGTGVTTESWSEELRASAPRRRSRTTFTREQKDQMLAFAERVGWRIQRQDEATVEQFCAQVGVRRQALKVWMHNNRHSNAVRKQQQLEQRPEQHQ